MKRAAGVDPPTYTSEKAARLVLVAIAAASGALPFACTRAVVGAPPPPPQAAPIPSAYLAPAAGGAPSAAPALNPPPPILTIPNPDRAELGLLARYPGFIEVLQAGGWAVLRQPGPTLKILDHDLLHGRDITVDPGCDDAVIIGDRILCGWQAVGAKGVVIHI